LDDGDQWGDVPGAGSQEEEGVQLTGRDQERAVQVPDPADGLRGAGAVGSAAVQSSGGRTWATPWASLVATTRSWWFSLDGGGQMPTVAFWALAASARASRSAGVAGLEGHGPAQEPEPGLAHYRRPSAGAETMPRLM
jgi:hypothetical protein